MEDGVLMRLNHATRPEKLVAITSFAIWITTKNLAVGEASRFVSQTRDKIERSEMKSVVQLGNERIAKLELQSRKGESRNIYAEFFARGNLILTDQAKDEEILEVARPQTFRHRTLVQGEHYVPPPTRGVPLQDLGLEALIEIHKRSLKEIESEKLNCVKWFGRNVGTSRKFVEEIFYRARVEPEIRASDLTTSQLASLALAAQNLKEELEKSELGYVLIPSEQSDLDVDVCSIVPHAWSTYVEKGLATIRSYPSLADALDEVQIESVVLSKRKKASSETRAKIGELESAISKQLSLIEKNDSSGRDLRALASDLMRSGSLAVDQKTTDSLLLVGTVTIDDLSGGKLRFVAEPRSFLSELTALSLASRLFDEAKRLEVSNRRLIEVKADLERQRDALLEQTKSQEERAEKKIVAERREKQWYERYRWFLTSNGDLAIGGRDSTSNSVIINKYMTKDDLVFHADLHGSPFFVLKRKSAVTHMDDAVILELAQATVSFSRAWKDELGSADAYWIQR
ncbi:MAG: NFACT RNA binding domain-containing protein, partial [Thaumarchaeota archaeon]|nr:NFACT RNA binding domain-containing protein [Nitrososphaerota archaeon]